jgi:TrkA domain protein
VDVNVTPLPGIGVQQDFATRSGRRVGVITYRDGRSELLVFRLDDPDAVLVSTPLTGEEAGTLASLLGAPRLVEHIAEQHRDLTGIETHQLAILPDSPFVGRTLGDTALRSRSGASVVAVLRTRDRPAGPAARGRGTGGARRVLDRDRGTRNDVRRGERRAGRARDRVRPAHGDPGAGGRARGRAGGAAVHPVAPGGGSGLAGVLRWSAVCAV